MSIYYLHLRRGSTLYVDSEGIDVPGVPEAVLHAMEVARDIMLDEPEIDAATQWIEVIDQSANTVRTVPFETVKV